MAADRRRARKDREQLGLALLGAGDVAGLDVTEAADALWQRGDFHRKLIVVRAPLPNEYPYNGQSLCCVLSQLTS